MQGHEYQNINENDFTAFLAHQCILGGCIELGSWVDNLCSLKMKRFQWDEFDLNEMNSILYSSRGNKE